MVIAKHQGDVGPVLLQRLDYTEQSAIRVPITRRKMPRRLEREFRQQTRELEKPFTVKSTSELTASGSSMSESWIGRSEMTLEA